MLHRQRFSAALLRGVAVLSALCLFGGVLAEADAKGVARAFGTLGVAGFALALLPQLVSLSFEAWGWKLAFRVLGEEVRVSALLRVRIGTEALAQSLPFGVLFSESVKPLLLRRHAGLSAERSLAGMAARKYLLLLSQGAYVFLLAALGFGALEAASRPLVGVPGLGFAACGVGVAFAATALGIALVLRQSALARGVFAGLCRLPSAGLRRFLERREPAFLGTDHALTRFFAPGFLRSLPAAGPFALAWLTESVETWLLLGLLGSPVDFLTVASFEVVLCVVRNVVFVVPAGLGVQDLGYVACLAALGLPGAATAGAAFVLLKRMKELFWIATGYLVLAVDLSAESAAGGAAPASMRYRLLRVFSNAR